MLSRIVPVLCKVYYNFHATRVWWNCFRRGGPSPRVRGDDGPNGGIALAAVALFGTAIGLRFSVYILIPAGSQF